MSPRNSRSRSPRRSPPAEERVRKSRSRSRDRQRRRSPSRERRKSPEQNVAQSERPRSPPRGPKKSENSRGFKWKKKADEDDRGGNDRDFRRGDTDSYKPSRYGGGGRDDRDRGRDRDSDRGGGRSDRFNRNIEDKFGPNKSRSDRPPRDDKPNTSTRSDQPPARPAAPKPTSAPQTFIIVTVNDRLGTKASIPCLPSDSVGDFKKMVAAHIGRAPHEIMLKRQGERPFKDFITLGDYGVSNGVQLDLELDTGD